MVVGRTLKLEGLEASTVICFGVSYIGVGKSNKIVLDSKYGGFLVLFNLKVIRALFYGARMILILKKFLQGSKRRALYFSYIHRLFAVDGQFVKNYSFLILHLILKNVEIRKKFPRKACHFFCFSSFTSFKLEYNNI